MKRLALILTLTVTSAVAVVAPAAAEDAGSTDSFAWKKCHQAVDFNLHIISARNMRCKAARRVMRRYDGSISRRFQTGGFTCRRVEGSPNIGIWRCKKGRKAFRFDFSD
jgi:hypothetical protein